MTFFDAAGAKLAFDRESVRSFDRDGRLHVRVANISKATVNGYAGRDVPGWQALGLDPDREYRLLRAPEELSKAAGTFDNLPILDKHIPHTADEPRKRDTIGTIGSDVRFEDPYLKASLAFWDGAAVDDIEDDERRELSCSYHYVPVVESGVWRGMPYDIRMTEIVGNHLALVEEGRAGHDVVVGDAKPKRVGATDDILHPEFMKMPKGQTAFSSPARYLQGYLAAYLAPKLANDAKVDLRKVVAGVTAKNFETAKPVIVGRLAAAAKGKLAADANLKDVHGLLDRLDGNEEMEKEGEGEDASEEPGMGDPADPEERLDNPAVDAEMPARMLAHMKGKVDDALYDEMEKMCRGGAEDEEKEPEPEPEEELKKMGAADRKRAMDAFKSAHDKWAKDRKARDAKRAADAKRARDAAAPAMRPPGARDTDMPMDKKAMDSIARTAADVARRQMREIAVAADFVRPILGADADLLAQDSAQDVYALAMDQLDIDRKGVHPSAFRSILEVWMAGRGRKARGGEPLAADSRPAASPRAEVAKEDPNFSRLRRVA